MYTACLICTHSAFHIIVLGPFTSIHDYVILITEQYYKYDNTLLAHRVFMTNVGHHMSVHLS